MRIDYEEWESLVLYFCTTPRIDRAAHLMWYLCDRQAKLDRHMDRLSHPILATPYCTYNGEFLIKALGNLDTPRELAEIFAALTNAEYIIVAASQYDGHWNVWFNCDLLLERLDYVRSVQPKPKGFFNNIVPAIKRLVGV